MSRKVIGIVDYGNGNHASVIRAFQSLNYQPRLSGNVDILKDSDLLVLPGVGAFPAAMSALHKSGLADFLIDWSIQNKPLVGFCLGMQLFADESHEFGRTLGLGLIPGNVVPLTQGGWHIGWNHIKVINDDQLIQLSNNQFFYFNHSFMFNTPPQYHICEAYLCHSFPAGVRLRNTVGLQFHPEKSQNAGRIILKNIVDGLTGG